MLQSWRWFGPKDPISLTKIRQAGATGVVTALHDVPAGEVWSPAAIAVRKALVEAAGLTWSVVESLPVPTAVRLAEPGHERYIERYIESLANLHLGVQGGVEDFQAVVRDRFVFMDRDLPEARTRRQTLRQLQLQILACPISCWPSA